MPAISFLFMAFAVLPLDVVMNVVACIEDIANIAYRLINFMIGIAGIGLRWSGRSIPGSLCSS